MPANPLALAAGSLRNSVAVQAASTIPDSFGQPKRIWSTVLTAKAKIVTATEREMFGNGQFTGQVTHLITLRFPGTTNLISRGMQVVCGAHTYRIEAVDNIDQRNRVLRLLTQELDGAE